MLARALRHKPGEFGIELDAHGWAQVGPLVRGMKGKTEFSREILEHIVATDSKGRYEFDIHHMRVGRGRGIPFRWMWSLNGENRPPPCITARLRGISTRSCGKGSGP